MGGLAGEKCKRTAARAHGPAGKAPTAAARTPTHPHRGGGQPLAWLSTRVSAQRGTARRRRRSRGNHRGARHARRRAALQRGCAARESGGMGAPRHVCMGLDAGHVGEVGGDVLWRARLGGAAPLPRSWVSAAA